MMHYDFDTLDDYLHGELDDGRDAAVHAHLEACAACRASYEEASAVRDWIRTAALAEEREFPGAVRAQVWEAIRTASPSPLARLRAAWSPWFGLPAAAVLAAVVFFSGPAAHGPASGGVAASDLLIEHAAQMADNPLADHGLVIPASVADAQHPASALIEAVDASAVAEGRDQN